MTYTQPKIKRGRYVDSSGKVRRKYKHYDLYRAYDKDGVLMGIKEINYNTEAQRQRKLKEWRKKLEAPQGTAGDVWKVAEMYEGGFPRGGGMKKVKVPK